ncbi:MAG: AMP-binding protein [Proteobacteria bacterium]|jgi:malonyl-CoA/methylmalonyl-CoA synthetase|nr:AMP-binding protein [Pseudomonadota bacterium]
MNFYTEFYHGFSAHLNKSAIVLNDGTSWTYLDLHQSSGALAQKLRELGVSKGGRVSVQVNKSVQAVILYLACLRLGAVFHPMNPAYTLSELSFFLRDASPDLMVCRPEAEFELQDLMSELELSCVTLGSSGDGSLFENVTAQSDFETVDCEPDEAASLLYSSGTTGTPKGIVLSHQNLDANASVLVDAWGFSSDDVLLHALPIFHVHGLFVALGCAFKCGASMRWLPAYDVVEVRKALAESTVMMGVPTHYVRLLSDPEFGNRDVKTMRLFVSGSAPLLTETFEQFEQRTGHRILERYGMTETNMNTSNPLMGERRPGTVGPPLPGVSVKVVGTSEESVPAGEIGDLLVKGDNVFKTYWQLPDKNAESFTEDGYFRTGDKALIDADGYVSIVGREKDMIISGGLNVYPKEIESLIDRWPGVMESGVIGVPHQDFGEAVVAVLVLDGTADLDEAGLDASLKSKLANFKLPKRYITIDELPRNTMGKVGKAALRGQYAELFSD